jgi:hypothetical protein
LNAIAPQEVAVGALETFAVDLHQLQRFPRDLVRDCAPDAAPRRHRGRGAGCGWRSAVSRAREVRSPFAASSSIATPRMPAERRTITVSCSGS